MNISLSPEFERFIHEQVRAGNYATAEDVIRAALARLMLDPPHDEIDDETLATIERSEAEFDRGECRPFKEVAAEFRRRFLGT